MVRFLHEVFGRELTDRLITIFDRMRRKRHVVVYEEPEAISTSEAENAVKWADEFTAQVEKILNKKFTSSTNL